MGQWITDLAAAHRTFAERLADRQSLTIPAEDPRYGAVQGYLQHSSSNATDFASQAVSEAEGERTPRCDVAAPP